MGAAAECANKKLKRTNAYASRVCKRGQKSVGGRRDGECACVRRKNDKEIKKRGQGCSVRVVEKQSR